MVQARLATGKGYHSSTYLIFQSSEKSKFVTELDYDDRIVISVPPKGFINHYGPNVAAEGELIISGTRGRDGFYARDNAHSPFFVPAFAGEVISMACMLYLHALGTIQKSRTFYSLFG